MRAFPVFLVLLSGAALTGCSSSAHRTPPSGASDSSPSTGTDCHIHVSSEGSIDDARRVVFAALDEARLARGCILSQGSHIAPGCTDRSCPEQRRFTEAENDRILALGKDSAGRLLPFCSVPVSAAFAPDEVDRCGRSGARGLKLHLVNEGISLVDPAARASRDRLGDLLARSGKHFMPVLVHLKMESEPEVRAFFDLVSLRPGTTVIAAHQIAPQLALLPQAPGNLWIEISGLTHAPAEAGAFFVPLWRAFGIDRVLLGSDHPYLSPRATAEMLGRYPLTPEERDKIVHGNAERLFASGR